MWAQTYDRTFEDVFAIQTDIATRVIDALGIALLERDHDDLERVPTTNHEAHEFYLRALAFSEAVDVEGMNAAIALLDRAVALDPEFAQAYAALARLQAMLVHQGIATDPEPARRAAARAVALAPDEAFSHVAMGMYYYHALKQYANAEASFERAAELRPNDPELLRGRALVQRRQSRWRESTRSFEAALKLNPRDITLITEVADHYTLGGKWDKAQRLLEQAIDLRPDLNGPYTEAAIIALCRDGSIDGAREWLRRVPGPSMWDVWIACQTEIYAGNYQAALRAIDEAPSEDLLEGPVSRTRTLWRGLIHQLAGENERAEQELQASVNDLEKKLASRPDTFRYESALGIAYAALGRREEARTQARRALEAFPPLKDTTWEGILSIDVARIDAMVGDRDAALRQAIFGLAWPSYSTAVRLRLDPWLKPVTEHPQFDAMVRRAEAHRDSLFP